jgi:hypothetical protein
MSTANAIRSSGGLSRVGSLASSEKYVQGGAATQKSNATIAQIQIARHCAGFGYHIAEPPLVSAEWRGGIPYFTQPFAASAARHCSCTRIRSS